MKKRVFGKLYKELFYIPKHAKLTEKVFRCRMITLLLTMLACTAVMAASTFALFYMDVSTDNSTIAGAYYSVTVDKAENGTYICPLTYEDKHKFVITASGTATTGYCKIQIGENVYYTEQILKGSSLTLTIQAAKDTVITFTPAWGTLSNFTDKSPENPINHSATPSTTYTVEPTVRLSSIAAHYGVTEEDILIYNNLLAATVVEESTTPLLAVGMELKIPNPAENVEPYKVPYATYIVEPTASLDAISAHYGIPIKDIIAFNDMTTYGVGMSLKIPNADPYLPDYAVPYATYTVEPTARLSSIAAHYGVTEIDILLYNNISKIAVGTILKIPGITENTYAVPYAIYIVEPTASLDAISAHYGIPIEDIIAFNDMTTYDVGMSLKIPNADPYLPDYAVPYAMYIVEPTATLANIAAYYNVSEIDILLYNNISEIAVGTILKIPGITENTYAVPFATYTIEATATLEGISEYYGISVVDIVAYNGSVDMTAGNVIRIPGVSPDTPSYVAPIPEPPASTDENSGDNTQGDNIAPPVVDDTVSGGDVGTGEQQTEQQPPQELVSEELAVLYPNDNDYYLISKSTMLLKNADILIYKGKEYQKDLDRRITGIEAVADINNKTGEYFCELLTNAETLSLCLEITENIGLGYLKIIIGESEYYTVQLKKDAYIRLDIVAPIGTEIRLEAYEGVPVADTLYGDDLKNDTDGNNPLLDHTWLISQNVEPVAPVGESTDPITEDNTVSGGDTTPTEQPTVETPTEVTTPPEETSATEQPMEETPDPEDITSNRESDGGEEPAEEPAPAGDEPTDTGATE